MVALTEMTNLAVDLIDVRKFYSRTIQALGGVNIQVGRGQIFGLLGPNGAGKSTLVKIMMTVVRPTHALGTILGRPIGHRGKLARIGYLPESHRFPSYLTGAQVLDYYAALARVPRATRRIISGRLLELVGMTDWAKTRVDRYSKGMLQRLGIAQSLMNDPELVVLDEPTDGLDPVGQMHVRQLLIELREQGKTVFLNSHQLSEVEKVCDRVAILVGGLVARQGTLMELTEHTVEYHVLVHGEIEPAREKLLALGAAVGETAGRGAPRGRATGQTGRSAAATVISREATTDLRRHTLTFKGSDLSRINAAIDCLRGAGLTIEAVEPHRFSLEDVLMEVMGAAGMASIAPPTSPQGRKSSSAQTGVRRE